jgi:hypothetical protein
MQIEYKKNMKHSYMVVIENGTSESADSRIAESVFSGFSVDDLIPVRQLPYDGDMTFWYNITGKISLKDYIITRKADGVFMDNFLSSLKQLHENLLRFYLCEDHIILNDETVFLDDTGSSVSFCYDHMYSESFGTQLARLMEKLITVIDHQDKDAVGLGYGLYEQCVKENADIFREITDLRKDVILSDHESMEIADERMASETAEIKELESKTLSLAELDEKLDNTIKNNTPFKRKMRDLAVGFATTFNNISEKLEYHKWDT